MIHYFPLSDPYNSGNVYDDVFSFAPYVAQPLCTFLTHGDLFINDNHTVVTLVISEHTSLFYHSLIGMLMLVNGMGTTYAWERGYRISQEVVDEHLSEK